MSDEKWFWGCIAAVLITMCVTLPKCANSLNENEYRKLELCLNHHKHWMRGECIE